MKTTTYTSDNLLKGQLKLGKTYKIHMEYPAGYVIINEMGVPTWYEKRHFSELNTIRKEKLDELLNLFD